MREGLGSVKFLHSTFPNSEIKSITKYQEGEDGETPELIKYSIYIKWCEDKYGISWQLNLSD